MRLRLAALLVAAVMLAGMVHAQSNNAAPYSKQELLEIISKNFCNIGMADPTTQQALIHFHLSQMQVCQCVVAETTYAMESEPLVDIFLAYSIRANKTRNPATTNAAEEAAVNTFTNKFNNAKTACLGRMIGR